MRLPPIMEKWDNILYELYNFSVSVRYIFLRKEMKGLVKRNEELLKFRSNDRCFVVMNGPSLNEHDLSKLEDEDVFTSNFFYRSKLAPIIKPTFHCWLDPEFLVSDKKNLVLDEIREKLPTTKLILNSKGYDKTLLTEKNMYFTYNKHMPCSRAIKSDIDKYCSGFTTVAFYAINCAIYMGYKEIYILGLDFAPGAFTHFDDLKHECDDPNQKTEKNDVCGNYWYYAKAHYEAYALDDYAKKRGVSIYNLNSNSCIRSFEFRKYEDII